MAGKKRDDKRVRGGGPKARNLPLPIKKGPNKQRRKRKLKASAKLDKLRAVVRSFVAAFGGGRQEELIGEVKKEKKKTETQTR